MAAARTGAVVEGGVQEAALLVAVQEVSTTQDVEVSVLGLAIAVEAVQQINPESVVVVQILVFVQIVSVDQIHT